MSRLLIASQNGGKYILALGGSWCASSHWEIDRCKTRSLSKSGCCSSLGSSSMNRRGDTYRASCLITFRTLWISPLITLQTLFCWINKEPAIFPLVPLRGPICEGTLLGGGGLLPFGLLGGGTFEFGLFIFSSFCPMKLIVAPVSSAGFTGFSPRGTESERLVDWGKAVLLFNSSFAQSALSLLGRDNIMGTMCFVSTNRSCGLTKRRGSRHLWLCVVTDKLWRNTRRFLYE